MKQTSETSIHTTATVMLHRLPVAFEGCHL